MNKRIVVGVMTLLVMATTFAQETQPTATAGEQSEKVTLTVEQAVEYAQQNSRTLKSSQIDLAMKERASKYGWNVLLPDVSVSGTMRRTTESSWDSIVSGVGQGASFKAGAFVPQSMWESLAKDQAGMKDNESLHWAAVGGVSVSWNLSLAYIQQIRAAKAGYEGGKLTWEQSQRETITNVKKLFYGLLLQQESLNIQKQTLENARQRAEQSQINYRNGLVPELALLNAQVTYQNQIPTVETAEQTLNQQLDTFAFLIGMPVGTKIELEGSIEPTYVDVDTDELLAKYSANDLQIQSLQNNLDVLKMNLSAINLATWTPALVLSYAWQPMLAPYALDFDKWSDSNNWTDNGSFSITLAWNITNMLPWSSNRQQAKDLKDNIAKLELTMETLRENQKVNVRKAVDTLNQAREQIDAMGRTVTVAQRSYDMSARSYRNGTLELLDLRESESQLNQAKLGQLNQKFNYLTALMDLEDTLNTNLTATYAAKTE